MKEQLTDQRIKKSLQNKNCILAYMIIFYFEAVAGLILLFSGIHINFIIIIAAIIVSIAIYKLIRNLKYNDDDSWYISKEIINTTKTVSSEYSDSIMIVLFDNKKIPYTGKGECCYGDTLYIIRRSKDDKPQIMYLDSENEYIGTKQIVDNTDKYNNEYYHTSAHGNQVRVSEETHSYYQDTTKFLVSTATKQEIEKRHKVAEILLPLFIVFFIVSSVINLKIRNDIKNNWIQINAKIESRELYSTGEDYEYKYGIVYTIDKQEYHSYIISTHGTVYDIDSYIEVYVNPNNKEEAKVFTWKTFK